MPEDSWHKEIPKGNGYVGVCCEKLDDNCTLWEVNEIIISNSTDNSTENATVVEESEI